MTTGETSWASRHFSIGLPEVSQDRTLPGLFRHVIPHLVDEKGVDLTLDNVIAISYDSMEGDLTIVYSTH